MWKLPVVALSLALAPCTVQAQEYVGRLDAPDGTAGDSFGSSVATNGAWVAVGAPIWSGTELGAGRVYLFELEGNEALLRQTIDGEYGSNAVGLTVALDTERLVVSTRGGTTDARTVFVHDLIDGDWRRTAALTSPADLQPSDFGEAFALQGNRLLIGAPSSIQSGFLFEERSGSWTLTGIMSDPVPSLAAYNQCGDTLALEGPLVALGARRLSTSSAYRHGAVLAFAPHDPTWNVDQVVASQERQKGEQFGFAIDSSEGRVAIGAPRSAVAGITQAGCVELFDVDPSSGELTRTARITSPTPRVRQHFGETLAIEGEYLLVREGLDLNRPPFEPKMMLYRLTAGTWAFVQELRAPQSAYDAGFEPSSLALEGGLAVIGGPLEEMRSGAAYVWRIR